jgi:LemA protein
LKLTIYAHNEKTINRSGERTVEIGLLGLINITGLIIWIYNRLIKDRNYVKDAWARISVQLTKRHDLIPVLVTVVKQYANHEPTLFSDVAKLRVPKTTSDTKATQAEEQSIGDQFIKLIALAEDYPNLQASENFQRLQDQLVSVEGDIERARRYCNGSVLDYRVLFESFRSNLIAQRFRFENADYFELKIDVARSAPSIDL